MQNVGGIDKVIRIVTGIALIGIVFFGPQTPWGWIGIVPLATGVLGYCPWYKIMGWNTCPLKNNHA